MWIAPSLLLAMAFALLGALAWGFLQWHTGLLVGPIAYGIGWGAAMGVLMGRGGRGGPAAAGLAVAVGLLGVVAAKACVLLAARLDGSTSDDWFAVFQGQFGPLDALWALLAVWAAWGTAKADRPGAAAPPRG